MNVIQINNKILINGKELPPLPKKFSCSKICQINSNLYWNGYKYIKDTNSWKWSLFGWIVCL